MFSFFRRKDDHRRVAQLIRKQERILRDRERRLLLLEAFASTFEKKRPT